MKIKILSIMLAGGLFSQAATVDFSYNFTGETPEAYGAGKSETIDVAIRLSDPGLVGKKVISLSVPVVGEASALEGFSAFLTSELNTKNAGSTKINDPDICTVEAALVDGVLSATFAEPYVIPAEGVYVGYSITISDVEDVESIKPVAVVPGVADGSFCYHSTKGQLKWRDLSEQRKMSSALTVMLEGDFPDNAVSPLLPRKIYVGQGEVTDIAINIANHGLEPVTSIAYRYEAGSVSSEGVCEFPEALPTRYGISAPVVVALKPMEAIGESVIKFEVTEVNGVANKSVTPSAETPLEVMLFVPKNRPLVEEYTGLDCGWCPGGYVTLRQMADKYGHNEFVAASFHGPNFEKGCMVCMTEWPYFPDSFPASQINRVKNPGVLEIPEVWESLRLDVPEGEVNVTLKWGNDEKTVLTAVSNTRFLYDYEEAPYLLSFMLVADGLSNPDWGQYNAYSFTEKHDFSDRTGPYWDLFIGKDKRVYGLEFDDVVVYYPNQHGIEGSLPTSIVAGQEYENTFTVNTSDVMNSEGEHIVKDFNKTRVIGMIIDTRTGAVVNSASSNYADGSGVETIVSEVEVVSTQYHDLSGRRLSSPLDRGVTIVTETLSDGTTRARKLLR